MKAEIKVNLTTSDLAEGQRTLRDFCDKLIKEGAITTYSFEIHTDSGIVTDKCILDQGKVIA
ncbi:MAG: hypothetical protein AB1553_09775 [Nitrospirota bacterium]